MEEERTSQLFELADLILAIGRHVQAAKRAGVNPGRESGSEVWTPLEGAVMRHIDRYPGTTAAAAADATRLISSNFARALRALEGKGMVRRSRDPRDARRILLYPTDKAAEQLQRLRTTWSRLLSAALSGEEDLGTTLSTLRGIEVRLAGPLPPQTPPARPSDPPPDTGPHSEGIGHS